MADGTITQRPQAAVPDDRDAETRDLLRRLEAAEHFPDQNPHPVLRVDPGGVLLYANPASQGLLRELGLDVGGSFPRELLTPLLQVLEAREGMAEVQIGRRTYCLKPVASPEFGFINVYATDITAARQVEAAHAENEKLLLNILPAPIAKRLRAGEQVIADRHEDVSLLFADIVGFTRMSADLPPEHVIDLLDDLFRHIDELVDEYELEKIKTIGDAYMVVGGLPPRTDDHLRGAAAPDGRASREDACRDARGAGGGRRHRHTQVHL